MGFLYAKAREDANNGESVFGNLLLAYVCPLGIHGLYDFVLSVEDTSVLLCIAVLALAIILNTTTTTTPACRSTPFHS